MRYAIIDAESGFIWGVQDAESAIAACRALDSGFAEFDRKYEDIGRARFNGAPGYAVYQAPADFECDDGQNAAAIEAVEAMPHVANFLIHRSRE